MSDVDNGGGHAGEGSGGIWEITVNLKLLYEINSKYIYLKIKHV